MSNEEIMDLKEHLKHILKDILICLSPKNFIAEIIFFIFKISESLLEPSLRLYIYQELCLKFLNFDDPSVCQNLSLYPVEEDLVQREAALYLTLYRFLINFPALFLCIFCGSWSDSVGRTLPIVISSLCSIAGVLCFFISCNLQADPTFNNYTSSGSLLDAFSDHRSFNRSSIVFHESKDYYNKDQVVFLTLLIVGSMLRGFSGKGSIVTMAVHSYVSDISDKKSRTERLGRLLSMNFFGLFVGSLTVGICLESLGFSFVFGVVMLLYFLCLVISACCMDSNTVKHKEDLIETEEIKSVFKQSADVASQKSKERILFQWRNVCDFFSVIRNFPSRRIFYFFLVVIIQQACKSGETDVTLLLTMKTPLSWSKSLYGYFLAADYACLGVATAILLPLLIKICKCRDISLAICGVAFKVVRLVILALSTSTWMVFLSAVLCCPSALIISCLKSVISKSFSPNDLGKIFALLSGCETFSNLIGNIIFNYIYISTMSVYAGIVFCIDSFLFFGLLLGLIYIGCHSEESYDDEECFCQQLQNEEGSKTYGAVKEQPKIPTITYDSEQNKND